MAVPKKRTSKSRQLRRRAQIFLKEPILAKCLKCGHPILPHTVCSFCGYYKGREVVNVLAKLDKKERKKREKEMKAKEVKEKKEGKPERPLNWRELSKR